jgi:uncharacterized protein (TIGR02996 family)
MHDEDGFLAAIRLQPADDTARLVFADWLDEHDNDTFKRKAEFIRLELKIANEPLDDYISPTVQLQKLAAQIDPDWLVLISRPQIEGCATLTDRECPSVWSRLKPTQNPTVRSCEACQKTVCYARTLAEAQQITRSGFCAAVSPALPRLPDRGLHRPRPLMVIAWQQQELIERQRRPSLRDELLAHNQRLQAEAARDAASADDSQPRANGRPTPRPPRRQKGRHRKIERENWEEAD